MLSRTFTAARLTLRASTAVVNTLTHTTCSSLSHQVTPFTPSRSFGILDTVSNKAREISEKKQEDFQKKNFPEMVKFLVNATDFNLDEYKKFMTEQTDRAGLNGWKSKIPGLGASVEDAKREIDRQMKIVDSFTPDERKYPQSIDRVSKARVSAATGLPVSEINVFLRQVEHFATLSKWYKSLVAKKIPLPATKEENEVLMSEYPLPLSKGQLELQKKMAGVHRR